MDPTWLADPAPSAEVKVYVLKSLVSEERCKKFIETRDTAAPVGFAVVVVGIIQLGGERVPEGNIVSSSGEERSTGPSPNTTFAILHITSFAVAMFYENPLTGYDVVFLLP